MLPFVIPAMLLVGGLLGLLGGGGALLAVPLLRLGTHLDTHEAVALALPVVAAASLAALVPHLRAGRVRVGLGLRFALLGMAGALAAGRLAHHVPEALLLGGLVAIMGKSALSLWRCQRCDEAETVDERGVPRPGAPATPSGGPTAGNLAWHALAIGTLTGLSGVGGGFLIVPALTLRAGLPTRVAAATSLLVIALNALGGLAGHLLAGRAPGAGVPGGWLGAALAAAAAGALVGSLLAGRLPQPVLRRGFAVLVLIAAGSLLVSAA